MGIRKEQVLALLTLGLAAWIGMKNGYLDEPSFQARYAPQKNEYVERPVAATPLASPEVKPIVRRDFLTEPSETRPLPPRVLEFPPRAPLSIAAMPLDPGPDFNHLYTVQVDGTPVAGVTIAQSGDAAAPAAAPTPEVETPAPGTGGRSELEAQAARIYDRVWFGGRQSPFFGTIEVEERDALFALEKSQQFDGVVLKLRTFSVKDNKLGQTMTLGGDKERIDKIALAGTLRNDITRRVREVPPLPSHLAERRDLIAWLLEKAREASWVYDIAMEQAEIHHQQKPADFEGLRLKRRVLRARGDLAGELAMLEALPVSGPEAAFRFEGLGTVKAQLGLWADAEADLRKAAELQPTDARPHAALAEFLRQRGRTVEAVHAAKRATQTIGSVQDKSEVVRIARIVASCHLAAGAYAEARTALADAKDPYVEACIHYAAGDVAAALTGFRAAGSTIDSGAASLGQAACMLRQGQLQEAHDLLLRVHDQEPWLRHRAATGLALGFLRCNQLEPALLWLDRAIEADPTDPYAYYLRGRALRLSGQTGPAAEALAEALRLRDDFVHAIAEMAAVKGDQAQAAIGEAHVHAAVDASRFADRAVELVPQPAVELLELQGLYAFHAGKAKPAGEAFAKARDLAPDGERKWYGKGAIAVVDYSRGQVDESAQALQRIVNDLPKEDALAKWAQTTVDAIDDHAQKESLGDAFDRTDPGSLWKCDPDGPTGAAILDGRLKLAGPLSRQGPGEIKAERVGGVKRGKNFLAASVVVQLGSKHVAVEDFGGLGLEASSGNNAVLFEARVGVREGKPYFRVQDGKDGGKDKIEQVPLTVPGFDASARHHVELRVVPRGDAQSKSFALHVLWNDQVVLRRDVTSLSGNTSGELKVLLVGATQKGGTIDVAFDDFRLERRKDNR